MPSKFLGLDFNRHGSRLQTSTFGNRDLDNTIISDHRGMDDVTKWGKVCRVQDPGSDCTSGDERSQSVVIQIDTAELISQTATLHCPRALLPAIIGMQFIFGAQTCGTQTVRNASPSCLLPLPVAATCCHRLLHLQPPPALRKPGPRSLGFGGHPGERS